MHSDRQYITYLNNNEETGMMMMSGKWLWLDQSVFVTSNSYNIFLFFSDDVVITYQETGAAAIQI